MGGWSTFKSMANGIKQSELGKSDHIKQYWAFIDAHCDMEYELVLSINQDINNIGMAYDYLKRWIHIDDFSFTEPNNNKMS